MVLEIALMIWLKVSPGATLAYVPKTYPSMEACERAAKVVRDHYNSAYDPHHEYSEGSIVDTLCL